MTDPIRTRVEVPHLHITLPLTEKQAIACVVAADRFGVEPWEMAVHVLAARQRWDESDIEQLVNDSTKETT